MRTKVVRILNLKLIRFCDIFEALVQGLETYVVCAVNASWSNGAGLAVLEQVTGSYYSVENNEKDDSQQIS